MPKQVGLEPVIPQPSPPGDGGGAPPPKKDRGKAPPPAPKTEPEKIGLEPVIPQPESTAETISTREAAKKLEPVIPQPPPPPPPTERVIAEAEIPVAPKPKAPKIVPVGLEPVITREEEFTPPEGAVVVEWDAKGKPITYRKDGVDYYAPGNVMWDKFGYETSEQYFKRQRVVSIDPKTGKKTVTWVGGGALVRGDATMAEVKARAPYVPIKTTEGTIAHITRAQAKKMAGLEGKKQFEYLKTLGVISRDAEYIPGVGKKWRYRLPIVKPAVKPLIAPVEVRAGQEVFQELIDKGEIPRGSILTGYDEATGVVTFRPPVSTKLKPFVDPATGVLRLDDAVASGLTSKKDYTGWDVKQADIDIIQGRIDAKKTLEPYRVYGDMYSVVDALVSDDPEVVKAVHILYSPQEVMLAEKWIDKNWRLREQYILGRKAPWVTATKRWYRSVTPWKEERGETALRYIKGRVKVPTPAEIIEALPPHYATILPGLIRVAPKEPTKISRAVLVGIGIAGIILYLAGQRIETPDEASKAISDFKSKYHRAPTTKDITLVNPVTGAKVAMSQVYPTTAVPREQPTGVDFPIVVMPPKLPDFPIVTVAPKVGDFPVAVIEPKPLDFPTVHIPPKVTDFPVAKPPVPSLMAVTAVKEAEAKLEGTIVYPKIWSVAEWDKFLPSLALEGTIALVRLDEAVAEAAQRGQITDEEVKAYHKARTKYLSKRQLLMAGMQSYIGGAYPHLVGEPLKEMSALVTSAYLSAADAIAKRAEAVATATFTKAIADGMTVGQAITAAQLAVQNAIQAMTDQAIKVAIQTITDTATRTATKAAVQTAVQSATQTMTRTAVRAAVRSAVAARAITAVQALTAMRALTKPIITTTFRLPIARPISVSPTSQPIPQGSIAFAFGIRKGSRGVKVPQWYYIPPPYTMRKPISLSYPPLGAVRMESRSPYDTIQVVGRSRRYSVPASISIDMGITDAFITNYGTKITFGGKGEETDVGTRMPETTKGMSIPASDIDGFSGAPTSTQGISRPAMSKKKPRRKARRKDGWGDGGYGYTIVRGVKI